MIRQTAMEWKQRLMLTGVVALLSPVALSAEVTPAGQLDVITVTAPRVVSEVRPTKIEVDVAALIDAIEERIADDQEQNLEAIGGRRIELAIVGIPTRG